MVRDQTPPNSRRELPRVRLRLTRLGFFFFLAIFGMLVGSVNYVNNVGFFFTFLLGGAGAASAVVALRNLQGVTLVAATADPVFAGGQALFHATANASDMCRSVSLLAGDMTLHDDIPLYDLASGGRMTVAVPAPRRGLLQPGPLTLVTEHPLSLFLASSEHDVATPCLVYPQPLPGPLVFGRGGPGHGEGEGEGPGVDDFRELRAYQPGDVMQRIAWKASTRGQGLFTKEFQGSAGASFYLDYARLPELAPEVGHDVETRLSRLTAMAMEAHNRGLDFGLRLPTVEIPPPSTTGGDPAGHLKRCLEALALFNLADGAPEAGQGLARGDVVHHPADAAGSTAAAGGKAPPPGGRRAAS